MSHVHLPGTLIAVRLQMNVVMESEAVRSVSPTASYKIAAAKPMGHNVSTCMQANPEALEQ
jgi:hypothetical protein